MTKKNKEKILSVDAGIAPNSLCAQKDPCEHRVIITYDTGKKESLGLMNAITIYAKFEEYVLAK